MSIEIVAVSDAVAQAAGQLQELLGALTEVEREYQAIKLHRDALKAAVEQHMSVLASKTVELPGGGQVTRIVSRTARVLDERSYLDWAKREHPTEICETVRPALLKTFKASGEQLADPTTGAVVPGVALVASDPYLKITFQE